MRGREHGGRATAHVESLERVFAKHFDVVTSLFMQSFDKGTHVCVAKSVLVKRTIRADAVAEGNMEVELQ